MAVQDLVTGITDLLQANSALVLVVLAATFGVGALGWFAGQMRRV